jgi:hypothetical protein
MKLVIQYSATKREMTTGTSETNLEVAANVEQIVSRVDAESSSDVSEHFRCVILELKVTHLVSRRLI